MLIAATLAMLGVPLWLVVGVLLLAFWSRRQFTKAPGVFPCRVRAILGSGEEARWRRAKSHGRWVHDVLLLHSGLALIRYRALPVASVEQRVAPAEARQLLVGPFGEGAT